MDRLHVEDTTMQSIDEAVREERHRIMRANIAYALGLHHSGEFEDSLDAAIDFLMVKIDRRLEIERNRGRKEAKVQYFQAAYGDDADIQPIHSPLDEIRGSATGRLAASTYIDTIKKMGPGERIDLFSYQNPETDEDRGTASVTLTPEVFRVNVNGLDVGTVGVSQYTGSDEWVSPAGMLSRPKGEGPLSEVLAAIVMSKWHDDGPGTPLLEVAMRLPHNWFAKSDDEA